jgi:hypothetical protein
VRGSLLACKRGEPSELVSSCQLSLLAGLTLRRDGYKRRLALSLARDETRVQGGMGQLHEGSLRTR